MRKNLQQIIRNCGVDILLVCFTQNITAVILVYSILTNAKFQMPPFPFGTYEFSCSTLRKIFKNIMLFLLSPRQHSCFFSGPNLSQSI